MRSVRLLPALVLLATAAAGLVPPASAEPTQTLGFTVVPALGTSWDITVPSRGPVWIEVIVQGGASATGLSIDGPGACAGATVPIAPSLPAGSGPAPSTRVDCGVVHPANGVLEVGTLGGAARGYLVLHGITSA